jgi:hypothetical protein
MPKTRINCPGCRQPIVAEIDQLFDVGTDPSAKQRFLSGAFNIAQCPNCGYQGSISTPLVYHDPQKELLLTFIPPEVGLQRNDQEKLIGQLINQAISKLPQEKRKAYIFRPQSALTLQGMVERVLEAEGITKEMIQAQQQRMNLIQRLISSPDDETRAELARQEDNLIDSNFFALLRRLQETALMSGDQEAARAFVALQSAILPVTTLGRELQAQAQEIDAVMSEIKQVGNNLTQEKLLDMATRDGSEVRLRTLVSLTRPLMDYAFFQALSDKIERSRGDGRNRLIGVREKLLEFTQEFDKEIDEHRLNARELLDKVLALPDVDQAMAEVMPAVDDFFVQEVTQRLEVERKKGDLTAIGKLQRIMTAIQDASAPPPEIAFIEELLAAQDEQAMQELLEENAEAISPEFMDLLSNLAAQVQRGEDKELALRMGLVYRQVLKFSMRRNFSN